MTDDSTIEARLAAVERQLDGADGDGSRGERIEAVETRVAELEAAVEAIEGYVGELQRVDREVERQADAALSAIDDLEARVETLEDARDGGSQARPVPTHSEAAPEDRQTDRRQADPRDAVSPRADSQTDGGAGLPDPSAGGRSCHESNASAGGDPAPPTDESGNPPIDRDRTERCPSCGDPPERDGRAVGARSAERPEPSGWRRDPDETSDTAAVGPADDDVEDWVDGTDDRGLLRRIRERL